MEHSYHQLLHGVPAHTVPIGLLLSAQGVVGACSTRGEPAAAHLPR